VELLIPTGIQGFRDYQEFDSTFRFIGKDSALAIPLTANSKPETANYFFL
jgi:hypothetical protein